MLGQLKLEAGGWGSARTEELYGLPVLRTWADPNGYFGEFRLARAGRKLRSGGVRRVLLPPWFEGLELLGRFGLRPLDPGPLVRSQSAELAVKALEQQGKDPGRATVALRGSRADRDMARTARLLCPTVRRIIIAAPSGGEKLARDLRWEFGIPVLPPEETGAVALCFDGGADVREPALELYGLRPNLGGLRICGQDMEEEDRCDLQLLAALWERGKMPPGRLNITSDT